MVLQQSLIRNAELSNLVLKEISRIGNTLKVKYRALNTREIGVKYPVYP